MDWEEACRELQSLIVSLSDPDEDLDARKTGYFVVFVEPYREWQRRWGQ